MDSLLIVTDNFYLVWFSFQKGKGISKTSWTHLQKKTKNCFEFCTILDRELHWTPKPDSQSDSIGVRVGIGVGVGFRNQKVWLRRSVVRDSQKWIRISIFILNRSVPTRVDYLLSPNLRKFCFFWSIIFEKVFKIFEKIVDPLPHFFLTFGYPSWYWTKLVQLISTKNIDIDVSIYKKDIWIIDWLINVKLVTHDLLFCLFILSLYLRVRSKQIGLT